MIKGIFKT